MGGAYLGWLAALILTLTCANTAITPHAMRELRRRDSELFARNGRLQRHVPVLDAYRVTAR